MPTYNRKNITIESIQNIKQFKKGAFLHITDDKSTEYDGKTLVAMGDGGAVNTVNIGVDAIRMSQILEFFSSEYEYCYLVDSDTFHDPNFMDRLFFIFDKTNCVCGIYNTPSLVHKSGFNIDIGDDVAIRKTLPGISVFFDKKLAFRIITYYLDAIRFRQNAVRESKAWDWFISEPFPQIAYSKTSYVQHLGVGTDGLHARKPNYPGPHAKLFDVAVNPTPFLVEAGGRVVKRLGLESYYDVPGLD
jgi:hypothetical protein